MDSNRHADNFELLPHHRQALAARALTDEQIFARGYRSVTDSKDDRELLSQAGIVKAGQRVPGLLLPLRRADGSVWGYQYRPDNPRIGNDGRLIKYESAHRMKVGLDVPPGVDLARLTDPSEPLLITEGVFKADAGAVAGLKIVALIGVWNWIATNDAGGKAIIPELYELAINGRVVLGFDGDVARKFSVQHAAKTLGGWLTGRGATVEFLHLPDGEGAKTGLDDYLAAGHSIIDVMRLVHPHLPLLHGESAESTRSETPKPRPEFGSIDGSKVLDDVAEWFTRFVRFTRDTDVSLTALWVAHTYVTAEVYTTPRLRIDSISLGSGKTTVLEHLDRLCRGSQLIASLPSVALIPRLVDLRPTTLLLDEIEKTLDLKNPGVAEVLAVINSGYRFGAKRPVLVKNGDGSWVPEDLSTFCAMAMAGTSPNLPADTRSRELRVVLMPDLDDAIEDTQWWIHKDEAAGLAERLAEWADSVREQIAAIPIDKPAGCRGRMWEKWRPLLLVATAAGGRWPDVAMQLIRQDVAEETEMKEALMGARPRVVVLLADLHALWPTQERFLPTEEILRRLVDFNAAFWAKDGEDNPYGKDLTAKGLRNMIVNATKLTPKPEVFDATPVRPDHRGPRGYFRRDFVPLWKRLHEQVDETPPLYPGRSGVSGSSDPKEGQREGSGSDEPLRPDEPGHREGSVDSLAHSLIEYCMDCGSELTDEEAEASSGSYCREHLVERRSGEEPSDD